MAGRLPGKLSTNSETSAASPAGGESGPRAQLLRDRLYINDGRGRLVKAPEGTLPPLEDSGGPVAAADFDRDGDLDLFVGGRVVPGQFPLTPKSRLLRDDGARFVDVTEQVAPELLETGMVTAAVWTDTNNDGWLDILFVNGQDWPGHHRKRTTPRLYRNNRNGTFTDVTRAAGLDFEMYGLGVAVADFNNDGFPDLYLTGVGQNRLLRNDGRGRFVDVTASPTRVQVFCDGQLVADHVRSWAKHAVVTDPAHVATAHQMRLALAEQRRAQQQAQQSGARRHSDGHPVAIRALPDYDALFGVDFNPTTQTAAAAAEASNP